MIVSKANAAIAVFNTTGARSHQSLVVPLLGRAPAAFNCERLDVTSAISREPSRATVSLISTTAHAKAT